MSRLLVAAIALAASLPALAGCLAPADLVSAGVTDTAASAARFDLDNLIVDRLAVTVAGGVTLDLAAFRPDVDAAGVPDEKVPVLADIGPYYGNLGGEVDELGGFDERLAEFFVPRGYAVVRASVRGTGSSGGCFDLGGAQEQEDVKAIVEFLAAQEWSNGNVAVIGKSYDGTTPWQAAITKPEGLKTIVPISGITDMYRYMWQDGVRYPETTGFNAYYALLVDHDVWPLGTPPAYYGADNVEQNVARTCADSGTQTAAYLKTAGDGDHDAFWDERDYEPRIPDIDVPVFLVHGLQDWNVKMDNGVPLYNAIKAPKAMWLGQWAHDYPDMNRFNEDWSRSDWNSTLLTWFDHWLKDVDNDWESLAHVEAQDQRGDWRTYDAWPPRAAEDVALYFGPDGTLTATPQGVAATATIMDPAGLGFDPATGERGVAFVTAPFAAPVTLSGGPSVAFTINVDRPAGNVIAGLYLVDADGAWHALDRGAKELRHRDSRDAGSPAPLGEGFPMTIELYPQELTFKAGERLGVALAAAGPGYDATGAPGGGYTVAFGAAAPSALTVKTTQPDALKAALS